jgi:Uri superfamily endonuclease
MPAAAPTATSRTIVTAEGGAYALVLLCSQEGPVQIGKLGILQLRRGFYIYVGSALGPGGVRARVAHHQKLSPRPHWHIDYLRSLTSLDRVWYSHDRVCREHQWARVISELRGASDPMAGFGSSDCGCKTHLFFFTRRPSFKEFRRRAQHEPMAATKTGFSVLSESPEPQHGEHGAALGPQPNGTGSTVNSPQSAVGRRQNAKRLSSCRLLG